MGEGEEGKRGGGVAGRCGARGRACMPGGEESIPEHGGAPACVRVLASPSTRRANLAAGSSSPLPGSLYSRTFDFEALILDRSLPVPLISHLKGLLL